MHSISEVRREPGSLECSANIAGVERDVWFRTDEPVMPRGDAIVPAAVLLAMTAGGTLELPGTVDARMLRGVEENQAVFTQWSRDWPFSEQLRHVEVRPSPAPDWSVPPGDRVGAFFCGGVDSFSTVLARPDVTDLIFIGGLDIPLGDAERLETVDAHLRAAAAELGRRFIRVDTNVRLLSEPLLAWEAFHGAALASVAVLLAGRFARIHITGHASYADLRPGGSHPVVDHRWAPAGLEIFHDGARLERDERVALLGGAPAAPRRRRSPARRRVSHAAQPIHRIRDVRRAPGCLEFSADIAGIQRGVWFRASEPVTPRGDAVLPASLLLAMSAGGTLELPGSVSPRMLRGAAEIQAVFAHWTRNRALAGRPLPLLPVVIDTRAEPDWSVPPGDRTALFFSGGVDSFAAVLDRPEITDLVFVGGLDVPLDDPERLAEVDAHLRGAAAELSKRYIRVDTNIRRLSDQVPLPWMAAYGAVLGSVAGVLAGLVKRIFIAGPVAYAGLYPTGSHPLIDHHWAPEGMEIVHELARFERTERIERVAGHPVVRRRLRVCWQNARTPQLNCGTCNKCLLTMAPLAAVGALERFETFPALDLDRLASVTSSPVARRFWADNLALAHAHRAPRPLIDALDSILARRAA